MSTIIEGIPVYVFNISTIPDALSSEFPMSTIIEGIPVYVFNISSIPDEGFVVRQGRVCMIHLYTVNYCIGGLINKY